MIDITKKTLEELKSLAYDTMVELQRVQNNLQILNNEIFKKTTPEEKTERKK